MTRKRKSRRLHWNTGSDYLLAAACGSWGGLYYAETTECVNCERCLLVLAAAEKREAS